MELNKKEAKFRVLLMSAVLMIIFLIILVIAAPSFSISRTNSSLTEDQTLVFVYNLTSNVTNNDNDTLIFEFVNITSVPNYNFSSYTQFYWISLNSSTGILTINSTQDNETGKFNVSVFVHNSQGSGQSDVFYFTVNATNDAPNFTNIQTEYNLTQDQNFLNYLNATDEEMHYPLSFNITFPNICTHATWSSRTNCSLFSLANMTNTSSLMNFTPLRNDVGVYYANVSVRDYGENYTCSSGYCSTNYSQNKTTYYSTLITLNIFSALEINATDCQNKIFQENISNICQINITSRGTNDSLNISSTAFVRNYPGNVSNASWFYTANLTNSINFTKTMNINVTPGKTEVGNWTINFTVRDLTSNQNITAQIYIYVNRTYNDLPEIASINNINTSINLLTRVNLTVYDDDLIIPDKFQGYNETINFTTRVLNQSNLSQELNISNFSLQILSMPVAGTNRTEAKIEFIPNSTDYGNYFVNLSIRDKENSLISTHFNISLMNNHAPNWNSTIQTVFLIWENNLTYLNLSKNISDPDGNSLTFSFTNDTSFPSFSLNSTTGEVNFTPVDGDVGQHIVTITVTDVYLTNSTTLNFTVYNINDNPYIEKPLQSSDVINASVDSNSNINASEDNLTTINLWIQDDDFRIPSGQKSFYNENLSVNLTIQGTNSSLFTFVKNNAFPTQSGANANRSKYEAVFIPKKSDLGNYNITINVSDSSNLSNIIRINLTIIPMQHDPILMNLTNKTSAINRSFYYIINATDAEDGNTSTGGNSNFTFSYNFISGTDFINNNLSIFNRTTGELNITFNSSQGGNYRINITVNDSSGRIDYDSFWLNVYDAPAVNFPASSYQFNLIENNTYNLSFQLNHSVGDNLTYEFYIQSNSTNILRYNISHYGNNSNLTWSFSPNFTDEATSVKNLTLIAYPSNTELLNRIALNITGAWNLTINHTNAPLAFSGNIGGSSQNITGGSPQQITLSDYFSDTDASDVAHNQTIKFIANLLNAASGSISISVTNWTNRTVPILSFSASADSTANYSITAYEYNESNSSQIIRNVTSNNFSVELIITSTPTPTVSSGGGGGGGTTIVKTPVAFKIIAPGKISAYSYQKITVPINLLNNGKDSFKDINLNSIGFKNGKISSVVKTSLNKDYISLLSAGDTQTFLLSIFFDTNLSGDYEVLINATSKTPIYSDWTKIYINLQKTNETELRKYILFTEEFIVQNPNCLELRELLNKANEYFDKGEFGNARAKAEEVVNKCKEYVSQVSLPRDASRLKFGINEYLVIISLASILFGMSYYYIKRRRISKL